MYVGDYENRLCISQALIPRKEWNSPFGISEN